MSRGVRDNDRRERGGGAAPPPGSRPPSRWRVIRTLCVVVALLLPGAEAGARAHGPPRTQAIDLIVIHSTGGPTCDAKTGKPIWVPGGTLAEDLRHIEAHPTLGIHYMIDRDGTVRASVPEDELAHHVFGYSGRSIAIELVNDGDGREAFPPAQLQAVATLIRDIARRRGIPREGVKRHSDLDHGTMRCDRTRRRKVDPGPAFPFDAVLDAAFGTG